MLSELPKPLRDYVLSHTRPGSKMRSDLVSLLMRILEGDKVMYRDIRNSGVKYHVIRMKKYGLLVSVGPYITINPEILSI